MNNKRYWWFFGVLNVMILWALGCNVPAAENIFETIDSGNTTKVQQYISDGKDINIKDSNQNTLLMHAINLGKNDIVKLLLNTPIDINERNNQGLSALMIASQKGNIAVVDWLIEKDVYVNAKDKGNFSSLMFASELGNPKIVSKLLDKGAKIDDKNSNNETALILAVKNNRLDVIKTLLEHNPQKDNEALYISSEKGYFPILKVLLENNYNSKSNLTEALRRACSSSIDSMDIAQELISKGANINAEDDAKNTPLLMAIQKQKPEIVKVLISSGANVNYQNINSKGATPLLLASGGNNVSILENLIQAGANLETSYTDKTSPLMIAVGSGNIQAVKVLIKAGAKVKIKNIYGISPLMLAAKTKNLEIVQELLTAGSDINTKDNNEETALIFAIKSNSMNIMQELLDRGAPINSQHKNNETPLMYATRQNNKDLVHVLVVQKADIEAKNKLGQTALDIAQANKYDLSEKELLNAGAIEHKKDTETKVRLDPDVFPAGKVPAYVDGSLKQDKKSKIQYENLKLQGNISIDIPKDWEILSADTIETIKNTAQQYYQLSGVSRKQILGVNAVPEGAMIRLSISKDGFSGPMLNMATEQDFKEAGRELKRSMNSISHKTNIRVLDDPKVYATKWNGLTCGVISYTRSDAKDSKAKWQVIQQHIPFKGKTLTFTTSLKIGVNTEKNYRKALEHIKNSLKIN